MYVLIVNVKSIYMFRYTGEKTLRGGGQLRDFHQIFCKKNINL